MTSLAANGRAGSAEDEKSVFNLCFAELSFSHARKRRKMRQWWMSELINGREEVLVGMLSSGHGSATLSVCLSLYPGRRSWNRFPFLVNCVCVCEFKLVCFYCTPNAYSCTHANVCQSSLTISLNLLRVHLSIFDTPDRESFLSLLLSSLPPTWNLSSFVLSHFTKICNPVAKTACHLHDNTLLIHKLLVG